MKNTHFLKIIEEISTDLNPWEIFLPFSKKLNNVLLESSLIDKKLGKYSIIGIDPFLIFKSKNNKNKITYPFINKTSVIYGNTFDVLGQLIKKYSFIKDKSFPIYGEAIGYFAYEQFHNVESKLKIKTIDDLKLPDSYFCFYDIVILFDHFKNKKYIIAIDYLNNKTKLQKRIRDIKDIIKKTSKLKRIDIKNTKFMHKPISSASQKEYEDMVKKIRDYIKAGDIYQVCSTYKMYMNYSNSPQTLYHILRQINPAPFSCYLNYPKFQVISSSPERFLSILNGNIQARPIKGTRPRGKNKHEDDKHYIELKKSIKDKAENVMIVDLLRNDIGRVCKTGTVKVSELFKIERYATVLQLVSTIEGVLDRKYTNLECLKACFPGGSMTGTPKIRAMEIISELEKYNRGIYSGCIGYIGFNKNMDFNIVIRTIILKNKKAYFNVGGGIVYDSVPLIEYYESLDKAKALISAINYAQNLEASL